MSASRGAEISPDRIADVVTSLAAEELAIQDGFLTPAASRELVSCIRERGELAPARVGGPGAARRSTEIRGDSVCWIEAPLLAAEERLLARLEELRLALNRTLQLGLFDLELHYACYPAGAGYARHVDQPRGRERRCVSLVVYLNETWACGAGGELRIAEPSGGHRDIEPIAGRLVCFMSAGREHEVLPARRERLSISGWYSTRA
ncbi:MAG TPA: 2OG-Fe(II) oxygenase [Steroidobacteraceae bacterium]|jgi:SM-20-related protein|nr:2OG-Fe(II) oxygenase [Steroidobacteraceae bacterium]